MSFDPIPYQLIFWERGVPIFWENGGPKGALPHWLTVFGVFVVVFLSVAVCVSLSVRVFPVLWTGVTSLLSGRGLPANWLSNLVASFVEGLQAVVHGIVAGLRDMSTLSPRRVWALASLTMREAFRRKALLVFVIFAVVFMFAGWFLPHRSVRTDDQIKNYVSVVMTSVTYLTLPAMLLLSCFGLPQDIKARSIHTVVTKPARRNEIVLGRMLGFSIVGTVLVVVMGFVGYVWIYRQLPDDANLVSRVPIYSDEMQFLNRAGAVGKGVNVGNLWDFREYIDGASKARAIWIFKDVRPKYLERFYHEVEADESLANIADTYGTSVDRLVEANGLSRTEALRPGQLIHITDKDWLRLEARFEAFRTHKGDMRKTVFGRLLVAKGNLHVPVQTFPVAEFHQNDFQVPRKLKHNDQEYDLIDDMLDNETLRIEVQCLDSGQFLGMARPDLFIRLPDRHFASGFWKAIFGIWLMIVLVVVLCVTASCFAKGPIAMILTASFIVVGMGFREFLHKLVTGALEGGGPCAAWIRLVNHMNDKTPLPEGIPGTIANAVDPVLIVLLKLAENIIPNFQYFQMTPYVANGFDVPWSAAPIGLLPSLMVTIGFFLPCLLVGYYSLSLRELESK